MGYRDIGSDLNRNYTKCLTQKKTLYYVIFGGDVDGLRFVVILTSHYGDRTVFDSSGSLVVLRRSPPLLLDFTRFSLIKTRRRSLCYV